jgi:hypothetical protein
VRGYSYFRYSRFNNSFGKSDKVSDTNEVFCSLLSRRRFICDVVDIRTTSLRLDLLTKRRTREFLLCIYFSQQSSNVLNVSIEMQVFANRQPPPDNRTADPPVRK